MYTMVAAYGSIALHSGILLYADLHNQLRDSTELGLKTGLDRDAPFLPGKTCQPRHQDSLVDARSHFQEVAVQS